MDNLSHTEQLERAESSVRKAAQKAEEDRHHPAYHASPEVNWMNDPNGLIQFNGEYHLYYQYNPYSHVWGQIHWGHMKSRDMVHWEHLPIALAPSEPYDMGGCFSGSAAQHDGKLIVFYTGNVFTSAQGLPDDLLQQQCMAWSLDGRQFTKHPGNPVIAAPPETIGQNNHFRDPKVWQENGIWYMVLGTKREERGKIVLYRSGDLVQWEFVGVLAESDGTMGFMYECPDLFTLGDKDVLLFSPQGIGPEDQPNLSGYYLGELDIEQGQYRHGEFRLLDYGFDFYAPQTMLISDGRRILFGWMPMSTELGKTWTGSMTVPRELKYEGGEFIGIVPVEELKTLRKAHSQWNALEVSEQQPFLLQENSQGCNELTLTIDLEQSVSELVELHLFASADGKEKTVIRYDSGQAAVVLDRTHSGQGAGGIRTYPVQRDKSRFLTWHIFTDRSVIELFINEGEAVLSGFVFPLQKGHHISLVSLGGRTVFEQVNLWELTV